MPSTAELLAALPPDNVKEPAEADLEHMLRRLSTREMPTGVVGRMSSLGALSAKLGMAYLAYWIRTWYLPEDKSERALLDTNLRSALNTLETMGYLRGAVAKLGQLLACFPESLPDEFVGTLCNLHFQAPPMHYALIREQLFSELGDPEEIFAEFDKTAIAAASIGQVHRARLHSGEEVAVKIQYPGIARAIRADLRTLKAAMRPLLFNHNWRAVEAQFDELRTGLERETDYAQEAQNTREIGKLFSEGPVVVPAIMDRYSTQRVLTMEFLSGMTLDEYLRTDPSTEQRDHYGTWISRALFRLYGERLLYTDAHPGNFLFMDGEQLGFIDFGNVRRFTDEEWQFQTAITNLQNTNSDLEEKRRLCAESAMMTETERVKHAEVVDLIVEWLDHYNEPILYEGKFDYGDAAYLQRGAELLRRATKVNWIRQKPQNVFSHRLQFQIPALMHRLRSRVNVPELMRAEKAV